MTQADWSHNYPIPDYLTPVAMFDDLESGDVMMLAKGSDGLWLHYWHKQHNCWVTLREATPRDLAAIDAAIELEGATEVRRC